MNIVLLTAMYAPYPGGGAERVARTQAEGLAARGHRVQVLTLGEPGSDLQRTTLNGVDVVRLPIRNLYYPGSGEPANLMRVAWHCRDVANLAMARAARVHVAAMRPDVVVCHNIYGWSAATLPAVRSLGVPVVQVLHDQYFRCVRSTLFTTRQCATPCASCRVMRLPHRALSRNADAVVGVSEFVLSAHLDAGYFQDVPLRTVIRNASHLDTRGRSTPPLQGEPVVFGFIGTLALNKGIDALLSAFVAAARPHWRLRIAGAGPAGLERDLRARYQDPRIVFLGRQDPAAFYSSLDATVVPSLCDDSLPSVVFESLVHGRPVIGTRRGGIPEMIDGGVSGLLYEAHDPGNLERALADFAASVAMWRARSPQIKASAAQLYCDADAWLQAWEALLESVVARGTLGRRDSAADNGPSGAR